MPYRFTSTFRRSMLGLAIGLAMLGTTGASAQTTVNEFLGSANPPADAESVG